MHKILVLTCSVAALWAGAYAASARAADVDPCSKFKWDVTRELAVMQQTPRTISAAIQSGVNMPEIKTSTLYVLKLATQAGVTFAADPARSRGSDDSTAGLVHFRTDKAGRYRVSMTSEHWVDIVDANAIIKSTDYQGHVGCERPRKIVEYELPAARQLTLQLSGARDAEVSIAITPVTTAAKN